MAPHEPPSWAVARLISWRTRLLAGAVLVGALFLDMLVLGAGAADDGAAPAAPTTTMSIPSTVVVGVGATSRPIPSVPATAPLVVAEPTTSTTAPPAGAPIVVPVAVAPVAAPAPAPAPAPAAIVPSPTSAGTSPRAIVVEPATASPVTTVHTVPSTTPVAATTTPTTAVTTTVATTAVTTTVATTVPSTTTPTVQYVTYTATSGAGDIVLAVTVDAISLHGFYPNANWVSQTERNGPRTVTLKFFNTVTKRDAEWKAEREGTRILVEN